MIKIYILLVVVFTLSACNYSNIDNGVADRADFSGMVYEFKTASGVNCVFAKDGKAGGLSCDWSKQ